jgi:hypothetical protein
MKHSVRIPALLAVLLLCAPVPATAGDMKMELKADGSNPRIWQTRFGAYGYQNKSIIPEPDGIRFYLPARVEGITQTGVYSFFAMAGDCEATLTYQFIKVQPPKTGYGCGMGLAFDLPDGRGRGDIQRVNRVGDKSGYLLHTEGIGLKETEDRFIPTTATWGRLGLRRTKNELIFLAADEGAELEEIERRPFTEETIRAVRLFADPGGSPTSVDVRFKSVEMRAEEITGGVAERDVATSAWWWLLLLIPAAGVAVVLFWLWRTFWRKAEDEEPVVPRPKPRLKKA